MGYWQWTCREARLSLSWLTLRCGDTFDLIIVRQRTRAHVKIQPNCSPKVSHILEGPLEVCYSLSILAVLVAQMNPHTVHSGGIVMWHDRYAHHSVARIL